VFPSPDALPAAFVAPAAAGGYEGQFPVEISPLECLSLGKVGEGATGCATKCCYTKYNCMLAVKWKSESSTESWIHLELRDVEFKVPVYGYSMRPGANRLPQVSHIMHV